MAVTAVEPPKLSRDTRFRKWLIAVAAAIVIL